MIGRCFIVILITCFSKFSWGFLQLCSTEIHLYHLCCIFFQMLHVNMLQHLFWASVAFSLFSFIMWKNFNFMLFSHYFLIFQITSWLIIPSQHQCIGCNFRPHNVKSNNYMFIYMLLIHNFLIIFHDIGWISIIIFFIVL